MTIQIFKFNPNNNSHFILTRAVLGIAFTAIFSTTAYADNLSAEEKQQVAKIIQLFKAKNVNAISKQIQYPFQREAPLPHVKNATEMKTRFNEIFDKKLMNSITQSKYDQWSSMGWRGVMLDDGTVWLNGDKISAVNYSSQAEQKHQQRLLAQQKVKLHSSIQQFKAPELLFKTSKYLVRIDLLDNNKYRYASWKLGQSQSNKPDLILNNGQVTMDGSGGNHHFEFKNGVYHYVVDRNIIGSDEAAEVVLTVTQKNKEILNQNGVIVPYAK